MRYRITSLVPKRDAFLCDPRGMRRPCCRVSKVDSLNPPVPNCHMGDRACEAAFSNPLKLRELASNSKFHAVKVENVSTGCVRGGRDEQEDPDPFLRTIQGKFLQKELLTRRTTPPT